MRILSKILTAFLLLFFFFLFTAPSTADIISAKIQTHNRHTILITKFEYSHEGYASVAVSSVGISSIPVTSNLSSQPDPSRIGFFLLSDELQSRYYRAFDRNPDLCALDIKVVSVLFTFRDLSPPPHSSFNKSYHVTFPGDYLLYFANCNDLSLVTMDVRTEFYNTDNDDGTPKDYLSADQTQPSYYFSFVFIYMCFLGFWISTCFINRQYFQRIHLLMSLLLVMAILHCICAAADQQDLKVTGTHHVWLVRLYTSQFMRNVFFFSVFVLISAGWCIWQPSIPAQAICTLTIVILLEVWATASSMAEAGPFREITESKGRLWFIDIICCVIVSIHNFWSTMAFKDAKDTSTFVRSFNSIEETSVRPDMLCYLFVVYFLFRESTEETCNFVFYMVMFYMFRPFDLDDEGKRCSDTGGV